MALPIFDKDIHVFQAAAMSGNLVSMVIDIGEDTGYCPHFIWTGAPVGFVSFSASNDGIHFVQIQQQATGGAAGQLLVNVEKVHYKYVQLNYTFTSGSGVLDAYFAAKRI